MKYLKTFENLDNDKIEISTSSHPSSKEKNKEAFTKLNNLLLSEENPHYDVFNTEELYLDDTDGLISLVPSSHVTFDMSEKKAKSIAEYIRKHLSNKDITIFVASYIFEN